MAKRRKKVNNEQQLNRFMGFTFIRNEIKQLAPTVTTIANNTNKFKKERID